MPHFNLRSFQFILHPSLSIGLKRVSALSILGAIGLLLYCLMALEQHLSLSPSLRLLAVLAAVALGIHFLEAIVAVRLHRSAYSTLQVFNLTFWGGTIGLLEVLSTRSPE